jgi:hypothetical protein
MSDGSNVHGTVISDLPNGLLKDFAAEHPEYLLVQRDNTHTILLSKDKIISAENYESAN